MEKHDEQFENYLREFQPRRPRALRLEEQTSGMRWRRFAAAATVALVFGMSLWFAGRRPARAPSGIVSKQAADRPASTDMRFSRLSMTQLAVNDPRQLDAVLENASRNVLPDFRGAKSTLRVLAKE